MAAVEGIREISKRNEAYAASHPPSIKFTEFPNMKAMMVVSCMVCSSLPHRVAF
jgi:hypothetical protein